MKTLMIIDDEPLIRRGLESMIPWDTMDYRLLGQASNGEDGLAKIREWKPDVVFTDIKMPKMDGITMMQEVQREQNPPVFIVLSGYDDYELVRSAMRLGAVDYLMKLNLDEAEVIRVLAEASERVRGQKDFLPVTSDFKEHFLREVLQMSGDKEFHQKLSEKQLSIRDGYYYRFLCLRLSEPAGERWSDSTLAKNFLVNICKEQIPEGIELYEFPLEDGVFAIYMESEGILPKDILMERCEAMESAIKKYLNQEVFIGIGAPHHNAMHVSTALQEALQSIAFHTSGDGKHVHYYTDLLNGQYFLNQLEYMKAEPDFSDAMETFLLQLQKFVTQKATLDELIPICGCLITQIYKMDASSRLFFTKWFSKTYEIPEDFAHLNSTEAVSAWLLRLEQGLISFGQQYMGEIYRFKIKKAKQYIYDNRFQRISLNDVAEELEITPSYLSRIFKKVTQKSFSDYVAEVKIEEAKKLLLQDNNRIYEVSNMLGYDDPYYFSKVFKRITQMTPSEYIARH